MSHQPHQQRVLNEKQELDGRIDRLEQFLRSPKTGEVPEAEIDRMERQADAMRAYAAILSERIAAWPGSAA